MTGERDLSNVKTIAAGAALLLFPAIWVFAFAVHPDLFHPQLLGPEELVRRAHGNALLQFAHVLVTLDTALMIAIAVHFMRLLDRTRYAWVGLVGAGLAVLGACLLAADKGAMCLTMSALDTLPANEFERMMPGLVAIFSVKGWMVLIWGMLLGPLGVLLQSVGLWRARVLPGWQSGLLGASLLFIGFPDGAEIINLIAALAMTIALAPHGLALLRGARLVTPRTVAASHLDGTPA